ncbi:hypothetical protein A5686_23730 [Mycobacterium sp. E2479]|nr:hypothetical protein A5686_23730 [Mycobacterium sp. E2479]
MFPASDNSAHHDERAAAMAACFRSRRGRAASGVFAGLGPTDGGIDYILLLPIPLQTRAGSRCYSVR